MTAMAVETRPELVGKRFLCVAVGDEVRSERWASGRCWRGWRAGVIRAVSHRDSRNPDLAVRERAPLRLPGRAPSLSQPSLGGLPLAPCSAWPTGGHAPLPSSRWVCPRPQRGSPLSPVASPVAAVSERDSPAPAPAPQLLSGRGSVVASPAAPRRPRRPDQKAGLRARRCADRWGAGGGPLVPGEGHFH